MNLPLRPHAESIGGGSCERIKNTSGWYLCEHSVFRSMEWIDKGSCSARVRLQREWSDRYEKNRRWSAGDDLTARSGIIAMSVKRRVFSALDGLIKCDRAIVCSMFLWYLAFLLCVVEATKPGICVMNGCNCTVKAHRWVNIKCVFSKEQARSRSKTCCRCRDGGNFGTL